MNAGRERAEDALRAFEAATARLDEALAWPDDSVRDRDATILRFLLARETAWKALRPALALQGIEVRSPREAFRRAFALGWIEDEQPWLSMITGRNLIAHTCREATAERIHRDIRRHAPALGSLARRLRLLYGGDGPAHGKGAGS